MKSITDMTPSMVRRLRAEALGRGDDNLALVCDIALSSHPTLNADGSPMMGPGIPRLPMTRSRAREICAQFLSVSPL